MKESIQYRVLKGHYCLRDHGQKDVNRSLMLLQSTITTITFAFLSFEFLLFIVIQPYFVVLLLLHVLKKPHARPLARDSPRAGCQEDKAKKPSNSTHDRCRPVEYVVVWSSLFRHV